MHHWSVSTKRTSTGLQRFQAGLLHLINSHLEKTDSLLQISTISQSTCSIDWSIHKTYNAIYWIFTDWSLIKDTENIFLIFQCLLANYYRYCLTWVARWSRLRVLLSRLVIWASPKRDSAEGWVMYAVVPSSNWIACKPSENIMHGM